MGSPEKRGDPTKVYPGLTVQVCLQADPTTVLVEGVTNQGGAFTAHHAYDPDLSVVLLLIDRADKVLIRCNVPIRALNPMDCLMTNPERLDEYELTKRWKKKVRELLAKGVHNPDPEAIGKAVFGPGGSGT